MSRAISHPSSTPISNAASISHSPADDASSTVEAATGPATDPVVQPLRALGEGALGIAGGKAANLGILLQADLPVPDGFVVTTAAYAMIAATAGLNEVIARLASVSRVS